MARVNQKPHESVWHVIRGQSKMSRKNAGVLVSQVAGIVIEKPVSTARASYAVPEFLILKTISYPVRLTTPAYQL